MNSRPHLQCPKVSKQETGVKRVAYRARLGLLLDTCLEADCNLPLSQSHTLSRITHAHSDDRDYKYISKSKQYECNIRSEKLEYILFSKEL
jgi:hypothetical protein